MLETFADIAKGLVIGVSIAAPVGPIGILCIRTTLAQGLRAGFFTGAGAATADAIYAAIGAFGISAITIFLESAGFYLRIVGILVLLWIARSTWRQKPAENAANVGPMPSLWLAFASTCGLTLTNPMTILSFAAIFAGAGLGTASSNTTTQATALISGTFLGSLAWWLVLSGSVAMMRARISASTLNVINKTSAVVLVGFALWMAAQAIG